MSEQRPAGWYDDPTMTNTRRYWDGEQWTDQIVEKPPVGVSAPLPPAAGPNESATDVRASQESRTRLFVLVGVVIAAVVAGGLYFGLRGGKSGTEKLAVAYDLCSKLPGGNMTSKDSGQTLVISGADSGYRICLYNSLETPDSIKNDIETPEPASLSYPTREDGNITYTWGYDADGTTVSLVISADS